MYMLIIICFCYPYVSFSQFGVQIDVGIWQATNFGTFNDMEENVGSLQQLSLSAPSVSVLDSGGHLIVSGIGPTKTPQPTH